MLFHKSSPPLQIEAASKRVQKLGLGRGLVKNKCKDNHPIFEQMEAICGNALPNDYINLISSFSDGFTFEYNLDNEPISFTMLSAEHSLKELKLIHSEQYQQELNNYQPINKLLYQDCIDRYLRSFAIAQDRSGTSIRIDTKLKSIILHDTTQTDYSGSHLDYSINSLLTNYASVCFFQRDNEFIPVTDYTVPSDLVFKKQTRRSPGDLLE